MLEAQGNLLTSLPEAMRGIRGLTRLVVEGNKLANLPIGLSELAALGAIFFIFIISNFILNNFSSSLSSAGCAQEPVGGSAGPDSDGEPNAP